MAYQKLVAFRPVAWALIAFSACVGYAFAAPFVVADVVSGVTQCGVVVDTQPKVTVPAASLTCKYDVSGLSTGSHTITMTAIAVNDPVWGTQESAPSAPFTFSKPARPTAPNTLRLEP